MSLLPCHINDPEFAEAILEDIYQLLKKKNKIRGLKPNIELTVK
jgi:hypothetical protein